MSFIIAIDGPAGSGKGTVAKRIAQQLDIVNIDTGSMYRAMTVKFLRENIEDNEIPKIIELLKDINIEIKSNNHQQTIFLNGENVNREIRTKKIDKNVSKYAQIKEVREKVLKIQRSIAKNQNLVIEGRDITTVVFPNADVKVFLDASLEERARRRYNQNQEKGIECTYEEILEDIKERHKMNTQRKISPLIRAKDAHYIDSSNITIDEVVEKILNIINKTKNAK